jgi:hypothetical protein
MSYQLSAASEKIKLTILIDEQDLISPSHEN